MQTHALSEPALWIGRLHLSASHCIGECFLVIPQLQPALCTICPDSPDRRVQLQGLRIMRHCLHEVVRTEHLIPSLALLLRALPPVLHGRRSLWLRLLASLWLNWILTLVPPKGIRQEQLLGADSVQPCDELHSASHADGVDFTSRAAPTDGQPTGVLVVNPANMVPLCEAHAHRCRTLVHLKRAHGVVELHFKVIAAVYLHSRSGDGAQDSDLDTAALVQHHLYRAGGQDVCDALAFAEAQGFANHPVTG
mmetsp:Transcript_39212/g.79194  ORF Transcript_39212/g.79194 Transcript_39212/m.79194 type:complete len:251 (-) Transcript_39212:332-1084(-)